jgi:predicted RNA binding protein YcfA (HicA-like mRNA interferase family)
LPESAKLFELTVGGHGNPRLTSDQVIGILGHHGFVQIGTSGSHQKWQHPLTGEQVIVAHHRGRVLPLGTMRAIIEGSGIPLSEWLK